MNRINERTEKQGVDEEACEMTMMMIKIKLRHPCDQVRILFRFKFGFVSFRNNGTHTQSDTTQTNEQSLLT
jgi:hypothetical protein